MASIYDLKPAFQGLLRPLTRALFGAGVTANAVTIAAAVLSLVVGGALALRPGSRGVLLLLPAVLFARMALNAIDGMLAREHGQKSKLGALLNELGDVVSDAALYLPLGARARVRSPARRSHRRARRAQRDDRRPRAHDRREPSLRRADGEERPRLRLRPARPAAGPRRHGRAVAGRLAQGAILALLLVTVWNRAARALREARP